MKERALLHSMMEAAPDAMLIIDQDGLIIAANTQTLALLGYDPHEMIGQPVEMLMPGRFQDLHVQHRETYASAPAHRMMGSGMDLFASHKDGTEIQIEVSLRAIPLAHETLFVAAIRDITERKRMEEAERQQRALAHALSDTAATINATLNVNEVMERVLHFIEAVVPHDAADIFLIESDTARVERSKGYEKFTGMGSIEGLEMLLSQPSNLQTMYQTGLPLIIPDVRDYPSWVYTPDTAWGRSHIGAPIKIDGEVIGFITLLSKTPRFYQDNQAEWLQAFADQVAVALKNARLFEALRTRTAELEASNRELDSFSHSVAHDLKSPLTIVVGYLEMLCDYEKERLSPEGQDMLRQASQSSYHMKQIIESLLMLAQLRSGTTTPALPVTMRPVIDSAIRRARLEIEQRSVTINVGANLPPVTGYGPWLEEVVANLISNAVKYIGSDNAAPRINILAEERNGQVQYTVEDNGMGIAPEHQTRLFDMFVRVHPAQGEGLGLGLSIVQRIIHRLGGSLGVESEPGKGSRFWFALPAVVQPVAESSEAA
jgi:PAS domain S-box-containing protein